MVRARRGEIAAILRRRILRGLQSEALQAGDRLPSIRELSKELKADPRVVAAAYRELAAEGLVELRPRAGAFASSTFSGAKQRASLRREWVAGVYAEGIARGVPLAELPTLLSASFSERKIRTAVVATTLDQTMGLCRELEECFGLSCHGVLTERVAVGDTLPGALSRAELIVTTKADAPRMQAIAQRQKSEFVCVALRPDFYASEYALLRGERAYVIAADPRFARIAEDYLVSVGGSDNVEVLIADEADLSAIPVDAPVYVTNAARERIGATRLPGGVLPAARILSTECAREIVDAMLRIGAR